MYSSPNLGSIRRCRNYCLCGDAGGWAHFVMRRPSISHLSRRALNVPFVTTLLPGIRTHFPFHAQCIGNGPQEPIAELQIGLKMNFAPESEPP